MLYHPGGIILSDIQKIVLTHLEYFYLRVPSCRALCRTPQSIADSFWRKDRGDRTDAQTVVDERLVARMDLEYGDDDIGSLEDDEDATRSRAAWGTGDARLRKVLGAYEGSHVNGRAVVRQPCSTYRSSTKYWAA